MSLLDLPPEIVTVVLADVDFQTVLRCRQVCIPLKGLIDGDTFLQYVIELGAAGMENGPASTLVPLTRLALLRDRQSAWKTLTWRSETIIPMMTGSCYWQLIGGVLAQEAFGRKLAFRQLPSAIRGIEVREWEIPDVGFDLADFLMDPSQDLLVLQEERVVESAVECRFHLKSLLTCAPHPAASSGVLTHCALTGTLSAADTIRIAGEYLGALVWDEREPKHMSELLVWNWRTGRRKLHVVGYRLSSFTFLTQRHVLLAAFGNNDDPDPDNDLPRIIILDMDVVPHHLLRLRDLASVCEFLYPELASGCSVRDMTIRSNPAPHHQSSLSVPFSCAREERLIVVALHLHHAEGHYRPAFLSFIPSSTFLSSLSSIPPGATRHTFAWADWGPGGSRFYDSPWYFMNHGWICYVYGTSFVYLRKTGFRQTVVVLDFNQRDIRRRTLASPDNVLALPTAGNAELVTEATELSGTKVFKDAVQTSLPYWKRETRNFDEEREGRIDAAMVDEDSLVLVSTQSGSEGYRVLSS